MWIDTLNDCEPGLSNEADDTDRAQQSRGIVNEKEKCRDANNSKASANKSDKLKNTPLHLVECAYREQQGKNEETGRVSDHIVAHQYRRNDTRGQLSACNLKGNKERAKRKNYKAKCRGNDGIEHRLGATCAHVQESPAKPAIQAMQ